MLIATRAYSSMAEQSAHNALVAGSNPAGPTFWGFTNARLMCFCAYPFGARLQSPVYLAGLFVIQSPYHHGR